MGNPELKRKITSGSPLTPEEIQEAFEWLIQPERTEEEIAEFLKGLSQRPITADLLTEAARNLRKRATKVSLKVNNAMDTCGTGGDQSGSFNFSTAAALVIAACGVPVAKHGNRSITSKSGSADLLEALGIPIGLGPEEVARSVEENHFGFMLAPNYHPALKKVQKVRRELKTVTVFNFLGPLLNPAGVVRQLVGVFSNEMRPVMAQALKNLGIEKAWVVWGEGGLDEMSLIGKTWISEVTSQGIEEKVMEPQDAVLRKTEKNFIAGGDATLNAKILTGIFEKNFFGPIVGGILLNAGAALCVAECVKDIREGVGMARQAIENGEALALLNKLRK